MPRRHSRIDIQSIFRLTELADYIVPFTIRVACDLRLADHLAEGPRTVQELAEATQTHAPSLLRALRALACKGIFTEVEPECFGLTPLAELLRSDHPFSLQGCFPLMPPDIHAWARSDYSVRTGKPAFDHVHGRSYYEYFADHPRDSARFDRSAASVNPLVLATVLPAYDWGSFSTVVDVGGGDGSFLAGILSRHPSMQGVLFDQPLAVANAKSIVVEAGVADRCELRSGDFFDCVPAGKDAVLPPLRWLASPAR